MKKIKKFESFVNEDLNDDIDVRWFKIPYEKRIEFLLDNFAITKKEAHEICDPKTAITELPDEFLEDIDDIRYFLMTELEKYASKYNI